MSAYKRIKIDVRKIGGSSTREEFYTIPATENPESYANRVINHFNSTIKPGESERELVSVEVVGDDSDKSHKWEKQNLYTVIRGGSNYDIMKCEKCGITGKRYGLSSVIKKDSKYKAKKYDVCMEVSK